MLRGLDCATGYDFARAVIGREGSGAECAPDHPNEQRTAFERLIRNWEALRMREELADAGAPLIGSRSSE